MSWKFKQIEPQPARGKLREDMWDSADWIAEEKYDGDRRIAQFCGEVVRFTGRRISVKDGLFVEKTENVPHLSMSNAGIGARANGTPVPVSLDGTVLDGEVIAIRDGKTVDVLGGMSKYVTSIMGSLPEEAVAKQIARGWLRYVVFDCLFYKGKDVRTMPLDDRRSFLEDAVEEWRNSLVSAAKQVGPQRKQAFYKEIIKRGGEGVILKRLDHKYGDKTGWAKVKKTATADCVIMGFVPAKEVSKKKGSDKATPTKYAEAGLIGAVRVGQLKRDGGRTDLIEVATISGMDDDLRAKFSADGSAYLGRAVEIEHNGREPTGRFRHPRFNRFRPDKSAKACVMREEES